MRCKTSCFNPVLCRNFLRRFWPLPLAVLLAELFILMLPLMGTLQSNWMEQTEQQAVLMTQVYGTASPMVIMIAASAFLSAALTFHHLHSRREIQFYHALPIKRRCLFLTSYISGFCMIAVPFLIGICLSVTAALVWGADFVGIALLELLGAGFSELLIFYSLAVFACCMAGQTFGALLIYGGLNGAALVILGGANSLAIMFMPGLKFGSALVDWLTPMIHLIQATEIRYDTGMSQTVASTTALVYTFDGSQIPQGFSEPLVLGIYAIVGVLFSVLGGILYEIRRSEMAGEMVAFPLVRTLCKLFGALVISAGGAFVFLTSGLFQEEIPFPVILAAILLFGAIGWYAAEMIVKKTFRVFQKHTAASCGILLTALLVVVLVGRFDVFGTVRYVPETKDVVSSKVCCFYGFPVTIETTDAVALHEAILQNRDVLTNNTYQNYENILIDYKLANGRQMSRDYRVRIQYDSEGNQLLDPITESFLEVLRMPQYCVQTWFGDVSAGVTQENFYHGVFQAYNWNETGETQDYVTSDHPSWQGDYMDLTSEEAVALYQAVLRDIDQGNLLPQGFQFVSENRAIGCLDFQCYQEVYNPQYGTYQEYADTVLTNYVSVELNEAMTETMKCLEEIGFHFNLT